MTPSFFPQSNDENDENNEKIQLLMKEIIISVLSKYLGDVDATEVNVCTLRETAWTITVKSTMTKIHIHLYKFSDLKTMLLTMTLKDYLKILLESNDFLVSMYFTSWHYSNQDQDQQQFRDLSNEQVEKMGMVLNGKWRSTAWEITEYYPDLKKQYDFIELMLSDGKSHAGEFIKLLGQRNPLLTVKDMMTVLHYLGINEAVEILTKVEPNVRFSHIDVTILCTLLPYFMIKTEKLNGKSNWEHLAEEFKIPIDDVWKHVRIRKHSMPYPGIALMKILKYYFPYIQLKELRLI